MYVDPSNQLPLSRFYSHTTKKSSNINMGHHSEYSDGSESDNDTPVFLFKLPLTLQIIRRLTGLQHPEDATQLAIRLNIQQHSFQNIGHLLPNLIELRMSNSIIDTIRDLGTGLHSLQVLDVSQCNISDLDGISSFHNLTELHAQYNTISDVGPCSMLDRLQILNVKGNQISDYKMLSFLQLCPKLRQLHLTQNPIYQKAMNNEDYRSMVVTQVPHIQILDDLPVEEKKLSSESMPRNPNFADKSKNGISLNDGEASARNREVNQVAIPMNQIPASLANQLPRERPESLIALLVESSKSLLERRSQTLNNSCSFQPSSTNETTTNRRLSIPEPLMRPSLSHSSIKNQSSLATENDIQVSVQKSNTEINNSSAQDKAQNIIASDPSEKFSWEKTFFRANTKKIKELTQLQEDSHSNVSKEPQKLPNHESGELTSFSQLVVLEDLDENLPSIVYEGDLPSIPDFLHFEY